MRELVTLIEGNTKPDADGKRNAADGKRNAADFRAIIFVQRRQVVQAMSKVLELHPALRHIKVNTHTHTDNCARLFLFAFVLPLFNNPPLPLPSPFPTAFPPTATGQARQHRWSKCPG